jgi:hypothetical protein
MKTKYINQLPSHHLEAGPWIRPIFRAQASPKVKRQNPKLKSSPGMRNPILGTLALGFYSGDI